MQWLAMTHALRWHAHRHTVGRGRLYQSRFKSFVVQQDQHFLRLCRYVERNPLRAGLVERAEDWRWGSLHARTSRSAEMKEVLAAWPVPMPRNWVARVNEPQDEKELAALRQSGHRGKPYGEPNWAFATASRLGIESAMRPLGRPKKKKEEDE